MRTKNVVVAILVSLWVGCPVNEVAGQQQAKTIGSHRPSRENDSPGVVWREPLRGAWVGDERAPETGIVLASNGTGSEIVVSAGENSVVRQASAFLSADIEKISGFAPLIVSSPSRAPVRIRLVTLGTESVPSAIDTTFLKEKSEAYQIYTEPGAVWLVGSDSRGTAYAAYTLSERLGIDPLYLWTGYTPARHRTLVLKATNYLADSPGFRYRGMFHDDEDILPRPFEDSGYPLRIGDVPLEWYKKFFETALRLRMNMVAPYTRVHRRYEVQKLASEWGLFFTSHHYDILLSNPFGIARFGLGRARGAGSSWDWYNNKEGMLNYWRGGVLENRALDAIWPVGLRGAEDRAYEFPPNVSDAEQARVFRAAMDSQISITRSLLPAGKKPIFAFTLYSEMLAKFEQHALDVPSDVILVWPDDNDGVMRGLPKQPGSWTHGVYYHLAYFGGPVKQLTHTVSPFRVATEFKRILDARATEYLLINVSELRDFVMEARMIADIAWDPAGALAEPDPASRYIAWWAREYFGNAAAPKAAAGYADYYRLVDRFDALWRGSDKVQDALLALHNRFTNRPYRRQDADTVVMLQRRKGELEATLARNARARKYMDREQQQFFFENTALGLLMDLRPTQAALILVKALNEPDSAKAWAIVESARGPLETLETEILSAERLPFEGWYRKTWIRRETRPSNVHRPYEQLREFLASGGTRLLTEPAGAAHPDLRKFCEDGNPCSGPKAVIPDR